MPQNDTSKKKTMESIIWRSLKVVPWKWMMCRVGGIYCYAFFSCEILLMWHKAFHDCLTFCETWRMNKLGLAHLWLLTPKHVWQYFLKTGTCKYGSTCKFHHPRDRRGAGPVLFNILGLPMHQVLALFCHYSANWLFSRVLFILTISGLNILRKKSPVLITCELDHASLDLHASSIIPSLYHLELPYLLLDLQAQQLCLLQVYLTQVDFLHGHFQEHHIYQAHV